VPVRIVKNIFYVMTFIISGALTNKSQAMEDQTSYLGIFIKSVYDSFVEPAPVPKFPHYSQDLATEYNKTYNIPDLIKEHLITCAEQNIILSTHEIVDTVGFLMEKYDSQNIKKATDRLNQLHVTGLGLISKKALCIAAEKGHVEIVEILLDSGVDMETKNDTEEPILHLASKNGHTNVVELLCRRGAEMLARNSVGCTALHVLCMSDTLSQETQSSIAKYLVYNAPEIIDSPSKTGKMPLDLVPDNRTDLIQLLVSYGAKKTA
jgi:hypothetical protein